MNIATQEVIILEFKVICPIEEIDFMFKDKKIKKHFIKMSVSLLKPNFHQLTLEMLNTNYKGLKYLHKTYFNNKRFRSI